jgi:hypothetical protein
MSTFDAPLVALAQAIGLVVQLIGWISCDLCDGAGEVTEDEARDYEAYWRARIDQLTAAVDAGDVVIP